MNHIAAIHVLKGQLALSDDDYRALLAGLTGKTSSKDMAAPEQLRVREHLQRLAVKMGVAKPRHPAGVYARQQRQASPRERKVWALWNVLAREGRIANASGPALRAWVKRQTGMEDLKFCNGVQLDALIEALKKWEGRA